MLPLVEKLKELCLSKLSIIQVIKTSVISSCCYFLFRFNRSFKNTIGYNLAGMKILKDKLEENEQVKLFSDISTKYKDKVKKKKKKVTLVALKSAAALST